MGISREGVEILPSAFHLWDIAVEFKGLSKNCFWPPVNRRRQLAETLSDEMSCC